MQAGAGDDRQDPGDDRHLDTGVANLLEPIEVDGVVEEELADQELGAGVDLLAKEGDVGLRRCGLGVDLGKARGTDAEPRRRLAAADERGQLGRAAQAARWRREIGLPARRIPAQGEDVVDPGGFETVEDRVEALDRLADDAEVRHRLDPVVALEPGRDLDRSLACRTGRPVGDGDEPRLKRSERLDRFP